MKKKILIMVVIILIIVIVVGLSIFVMNKNKGKDVVVENENVNILVEDNKVSDKKMYDELEVQNTKIEKEGDQTNFTFTIKNNKQEKYEGGYARIECLNKENEQVGNVIVYIPEIEVGESIEVNSSTDMEITEIYNYQIVSSEI